MPRASEQDVASVMDTALNNDQLAPFLRSASVVVDNNLTSEGYSSDTLREIEIWLAAHFACARDKQLQEERVGGGAWKYEGKTDLGLNGTQYGQRVMLLDHHGRLAQLGKGAIGAYLECITDETQDVDE